MLISSCTFMFRNIKFMDNSTYFLKWWSQTTRISISNIYLTGLLRDFLSEWYQGVGWYANVIKTPNMHIPVKIPAVCSLTSVSIIVTPWKEFWWKCFCKSKLTYLWKGCILPDYQQPHSIDKGSKRFLKVKYNTLDLLDYIKMDSKLHTNIKLIQLHKLTLC